MNPAPFEYVRAESARRGAGRTRARRRREGAHWRHLAAAADEAPARDTDCARRRRPRALSYVENRGDHVAAGALTRHRDLETSAVLAEHCGVLRAVAAEAGDNQVRHRGTIGGSVARCDPASDLPAALLALDATFVAQGPEGAREIPASDFFQGFLEAALRPTSS